MAEQQLWLCYLFPIQPKRLKINNKKLINLNKINLINLNKIKSGDHLPTLQALAYLLKIS